ncbi:hypothetical protein FA15DRAFT_591392, partial [Coprinopsis marcescibilis]
LCLDEIANDGWLCWIPTTDDISGPCKHASELDSTKIGLNLTTIHTVNEAVQSGKVHVGQELLVAAFAQNDRCNYSTKPVLILPTCKCGLFEDAALILEKLLPYGEDCHGPICVKYLSDGGLKQCPVLYLHCIICEIVPSDALFQHVGFLQALNLWTGSNFEMQNLDWKHYFKHEFL